MLLPCFTTVLTEESPTKTTPVGCCDGHKARERGRLQLARSELKLVRRQEGLIMAGVPRLKRGRKRMKKGELRPSPCEFHSFDSLTGCCIAADDDQRLGLYGGVDGD